MSTGFFILLGVSVVMTIIGIAAASVHADMLAKSGKSSKNDIPTTASQTAANVTIAGLAIFMIIWPLSPPWYKSKPMDSVYKMVSNIGIFKPQKIAGSNKKEQEGWFRYMKLAVISCPYAAIWGVFSMLGAKSATANAGSSSHGGGGGGGKNFKQPRSPWSNKPY